MSQRLTEAERHHSRIRAALIVVAEVLHQRIEAAPIFERLEAELAKAAAAIEKDPIVRAALAEIDSEPKP